MSHLLFVHALSPLHAGTGSDVGVVDLPIARDKATGFPYLPGSTLKGVLRDAASRIAGLEVEKLFGPERTANEKKFAGALLVGDANLLLLPVRSLVGTFAWVTSPWLLQRFARDARESNQKGFTVPAVPSLEKAFVSKETAIVNGDRIVFEDLDFAATKSEIADDLATWLGERMFPDGSADAAAWRALLKRKLCILHDDAMAFFSQHGTDVVTRIAIDQDRKTVIDGALWTEESLPAETILVSMLAGQANGQITDAKTVVESIRPVLDRSVQLGGDATIGRGRCRLVLCGGAK